MGFGGAGDSGGPDIAVGQWRIFEGAEFTQEDRAVMRQAPRFDAVQISIQRNMIGWCAPMHVMKRADFGAHPGSALMGERERAVIEESDDDVGIIG